MSRMDMTAPSTTTPATTMTRRSSLPSEEAAVSPIWLSVSVLIGVVLSSSRCASYSDLERRQGRRHRRPDIRGLRALVGWAAQVVADLAAEPEGDVGGGEQRDRRHDREDLPVAEHHDERGAEGQRDRLRRRGHD